MNKERVKFHKAIRKVKKIKSFYIHLITYVLINLFLFFLNISTSPDTLWFFWPLLGWGIFVVIDGFSTFGFDYLFGKDWEEKKLKEIMEKEDDESFCNKS